MIEPHEFKTRVIDKRLQVDRITLQDEDVVDTGPFAVRRNQRAFFAPDDPGNGDSVIARVFDLPDRLINDR